MTVQAFENPAQLLQHIVVAFGAQFRERGDHSTLLTVEDGHRRVPDPHHEVERHLLAGFPRFAHLAGDIADGDLHGVSVMRHGGHEIVETVLEMHDAAHRDDEVDQREHAAGR